MGKKLEQRPWTIGWGDYLLQMVLRTGGRFRYLAALAYIGTPTRLAGKRGNTPGVARHNRPQLQRYGRKRVTG